MSCEYLGTSVATSAMFDGLLQKCARLLAVAICFVLNPINIALPLGDLNVTYSSFYFYFLNLTQKKLNELHWPFDWIPRYFKERASGQRVGALKSCVIKNRRPYIHTGCMEHKVIQVFTRALWVLPLPLSVSRRPTGRPTVCQQYCLCDDSLDQGC